ncbi:MAG: FAD-dependent oxidoreductase [Gammaproteobacteria bacterium]|nr:FAD-dependent oxidoreductase [Gammaproteobacteria bacterium]
MREYDVVVVGAGINGCGVAQAAAAAGYSVLVLEQTGLAAGTSSKSSKLVHGGLRYLETFQFSLVRESLRERALLLRLAPELVQLQHFRVPLYAGGRRGPLTLRAGLLLYYWLSGRRPEARFTALARRDWSADGLRTEGLRAVFRYTDARTDDAALTRAVMRSAESLGAELVVPARVTAIDLTDSGAHVHYRWSGAELTCRARIVINAAGPWVGRVMDTVTPAVPPLQADLVQGTHIEVAADRPGGDFYYVESPDDGRAVFVMPRSGRLIIGTTETPYAGDPGAAKPLPAEQQYLLDVASHYFPALAAVGTVDLLDSWTGLRVLPAGTGRAFSRSREAVFHPDRPDKPRMISLFGGKLTTYRATAAQMLERMAPALPARRARAATDELPLTPA